MSRDGATEKRQDSASSSAAKQFGRGLACGVLLPLVFMGERCRRAWLWIGGMT